MSGSRRTGAARRRSSAAIRTARVVPRLRPSSRDLRLEREVGLAPRRTRDLDRLRPARGSRARPRRPPLRGGRLAALLAFGWTAYPFTAYTLNANTNDAIMPAFLVLGFWLVTSDWARGAAVALAGWTKFGALLLAPLWATYPSRRARRVLRFGPRSRPPRCSRSRSSCSSRALWDALRTFWDRTIGFQSGRDSPFSLWGWGQYHARGSRPRIPPAGRGRARRRARRWSSPSSRGEEPGRARSAHRACSSLPAHADPLVLPLPPVGRAVRRPLAPPAA